MRGREFRNSKHEEPTHQYLSFHCLRGRHLSWTYGLDLPHDDPRQLLRVADRYDDGRIRHLLLRSQKLRQEEGGGRDRPYHKLISQGGGSWFL